MKNIQIIPIPNGVFGFLNVLPSIQIWTFDHFAWDWVPARYIFPRRPTPTIEVYQQALELAPKLCVKDWINEAMITSGYYALLTRPNGCFGIAYAERNFIHPKQDFIK